VGRPRATPHILLSPLIFFRSTFGLALSRASKNKKLCCLIKSEDIYSASVVFLVFAVGSIHRRAVPRSFSGLGVGCVGGRAESILGIKKPPRGMRHPPSPGFLGRPSARPHTRFQPSPPPPRCGDGGGGGGRGAACSMTCRLTWSTRRSGSLRRRRESAPSTSPTPRHGIRTNGRPPRSVPPPKSWNLPPSLVFIDPRDRGVFWIPTEGVGCHTEGRCRRKEGGAG